MNELVKVCTCVRESQVQVYIRWCSGYTVTGLDLGGVGAFPQPHPFWFQLKTKSAD